MSFDPYTSPISADLSRADVSLLWELCSDKRVIEFGCGGSTLILAHCAASLVSYDTSQAWLDAVARQLRELRVERIAATALRLQPTTEVPAEVEPADILFIDGLTSLRAKWLEVGISQQLAPVILLHDSRRAQPLASCLSLLTWPITAWVDSVQYHAPAWTNSVRYEKKSSNMVVIRLRAEPVRYENWNLAESNRAPHLNALSSGRA